MSSVATPLSEGSAFKRGTVCSCSCGCCSRCRSPQA